MATPEAAATEPATGSLRNKVFVALAGVLVVGLAAALFLFLRGTGAGPATPPPEPARPIFVNFEPVTVNLLAEAKPRFLHMAISLKVHDEEAQARVAESLPELRSRLLLLLSNRDPAGLASPQAKSALAEEIRNELNRPPAAGRPAYGITAVAFTAFVVQ